MSKDVDDIGQLYGESAAGIYIPPAETQEDIIKATDSGSVYDSYFGDGTTTKQQPVIQEQQVQPVQHGQFLTEAQMVNHHLDAAIANLQKVAPLYESVKTQSYFGDIIDAISEMRQ